MKNLKTLLILLTLLAGTATAHAASHAGAPMTTPAASANADSSASAAEMADGEIRRIDMASKKITIKHGVIKSLDMPGMTMVFQVKDPALLDKIKTGDKVRFRAEKANGAMVVTEMEPAK